MYLQNENMVCLSSVCRFGAAAVLMLALVHVLQQQVVMEWCWWHGWYWWHGCRDGGCNDGGCVGRGHMEAMDWVDLAV